MLWFLHFEKEFFRIMIVPEKITSRQNRSIISACELSDKRKRDERGEFFFEGIKLLREAKRENIDIISVFATSDAISKYGNELFGDYKIFEVSDDVYKKLTSENAPQGVFCVAKKLSPAERPSGLSIMLDGVADPGNLGTVIRCADAFGVEKIYLSEDCADVYNPKTVRAAMGSAFRVPCVRGSLTCSAETLRLGGYRIYAAMLDRDSERIENIEKGGKTAFVIGNEGHGVSPAVRGLCDGSVIIPMKEDSAESLNASVAAAIIMWEHRRI